MVQVLDSFLRFGNGVGLTFFRSVSASGRRRSISVWNASSSALSLAAAAASAAAVASAAVAYMIGTFLLSHELTTKTGAAVAAAIVAA